MTPASAAREDALGEVRFWQAVAPGGFAWLVPLQRDRVPYARIGLMANAHSRNSFDTFLSLSI